MYLNLSHYEFFSISDPLRTKEQVYSLLDSLGVRGTFLIAREGVNFNLAAPEADRRWVEKLKNQLLELGVSQLGFKESLSPTCPFNRLKVKAIKEIVTLGVEALDVTRWTAPHMKAKEFSEVLENPKDWVILDTRNDFEVEMGTYEHARPARMQSFRQFVQVSENLEQELSKDQKIVMFCTGGIRCEKASAYMRTKGFQNVYQLDGGILRHFEEEQGAGFKGQCFVFDERRVVDESLAPGQLL